MAKRAPKTANDFTCAQHSKLLQTTRTLQAEPTRWLTTTEVRQLLTITQIDQAALSRADKP
jgi:hypothetical protein